MSRPPVDGATRDSFVTFKVNDDEAVEIHLLMKKYGISRSDLMRILLRTTFKHIKNCFSQKEMAAVKEEFIKRKKISGALIEAKEKKAMTNFERDLNNAVWAEVNKKIEEKKNLEKPDSDK